MGDMYQNNQFQPTTLCGDAKVTVAQQAANRVDCTEQNNVHTLNKKNGRVRKKDEWYV